MPKNTLPRSRRAAAPKHSKTPARALDRHGHIQQRQDSIKQNRKPEEKARFEQSLQKYINVVRRQFRQGYFWSSGMVVAVNEREQFERNFRTLERMEAFEANHAARKPRKKAVHA